MLKIKEVNLVKVVLAVPIYKYKIKFRIDIFFVRNNIRKLFLFVIHSIFNPTAAYKPLSCRAISLCPAPI